MKKYLVFVVLIYCVSVFASNRQPRFSCYLNRSVSLILTLEFEENLPPAVVLQTRFQEEEARDVVTLINPQIIDYGHTFILVSESGKSGYVLLRIKEMGPGVVDPKAAEFQGFLDINLYPLNDRISSINTDGHLKNTYCVRLD